MKRARVSILIAAAILGGASFYRIDRAVTPRRRAELARSALVASTNFLETKIRQRRSSASPNESKPAGQIPVPHKTAVVPGALATASPDASKLVSAHPEVLALFEKAFRARFDVEYRMLFDQLTLSPDRIARFKQRLFQDRIDQLDLNSIMEAQGAARNDPVFQTLRRKQEDALRADLQEILGLEGSEALDRFRRANGVRNFVGDLAAGMTLTGRPMTLDQQDQLVQTIAEASAQYQKGGNAMPWDANWDAIMAKAPAFLTDAQVSALRENGDQLVRLVWTLPQFYAQYRPPAK